MTGHTFQQRFLEGYRAHLLEEERSASTVEKYLRDAGEFARWLDGGPVNKQAMIAWKSALLAKNLTPATVNAKLCAVNGLMRFLGWNECRVKLLRIQRRIFREQSRSLSKGEYLRLLAAARSLGKIRLELLMEAICSTGIRVGEVRYLTVEAVHAGKAVINLKGKIRVILLPGKLCRKLKKYAEKQKIASGEIFLAKGGGSLPRKQIWREMKRLCETAEVEPSKVFPHNLRHLFAMAFYRICRDIVKLADVLGHSSIETTRIYLCSTGSEHTKYLEHLHLIA